jgi:hypothetical protein
MCTIYCFLLSKVLDLDGFGGLIMFCNDLFYIIMFVRHHSFYLSRRIYNNITYLYRQ